jgi:hypothetical protein
MNDENRLDTRNLSPSATWALQYLAEIRYGREVPALGWAVTRELISAGLVSYGATGRTSLSITLAGRAFMKNRASPLRLTQDTIATAWRKRPPGG